MSITLKRAPQELVPSITYPTVRGNLRTWVTDLMGSGQEAECIFHSIFSRNNFCGNSRHSLWKDEQSQLLKELYEGFGLAYEPSKENSKSDDNSSETRKQNEILLRIIESMTNETKAVFTLERLDNYESIIHLYFELGQSMQIFQNKILDQGLMETIGKMIPQIAYGFQIYLETFYLDEIDFSNEEVLEMVRICELRSGIQFFFQISETYLLGDSNADSVELKDCFKSIKKYGGVDKMEEKFKRWWDTRCFLTMQLKNARLSEVGHWWWG